MRVHNAAPTGHGTVARGGGAHARLAHDGTSRSPALPAPLTGLIGRAQDIDEITRLLVKHRLVTVTSVGSIGKTRLATAVGARAADRFIDDVWLVDLAPLTD